MRHIYLFSLIVAAFVFGFVLRGIRPVVQYVNLPTPIPTPVPTPLARYEIENLQKAVIIPSEITRAEELSNTKDYSSNVFTLTFDPTLSTGDRKNVTGVINIPKEGGPFPLILMIRGYVDPTIYTPGTGTKNAAAAFASNGFITVAPDFLGYAGSSQESGNIFETRFQTYTTVLSLLNSLATPNFASVSEQKWDGKNIFIWAHSNGGQVALTTLAVTQEAIPTVLWAPVTKQFPYSVLYYTDESTDGGKLIRRELSKFETIYDVNKFSFTNYLTNIKAPIQFEQGTADDAIPFEWTRNFSKQLKKLGIEVTYNEYPGSDHNLRPAWNTAIENDLTFFRKWLK